MRLAKQLEDLKNKEKKDFITKKIISELFFSPTSPLQY